VSSGAYLGMCECCIDVNLNRLLKDYRTLIKQIDYEMTGWMNNESVTFPE